MSLRCLFGHKWHVVQTMWLEQNDFFYLLRYKIVEFFDKILWNMSHYGRYIPLHKNKIECADRICKRCEKVQFNLENKLKSLEEIRQNEKMEHEVTKNEEARLNARFKLCKQIRDGLLP